MLPFPLKFQYPTPDDSSLAALHSVVLFSCRSLSFHCYAPQYQYPIPNDSYLASSTLCSISTVLHSWLSSSNYGLHSVASVFCPKVLTCSHCFRKFYSIPHLCKEKILTWHFLFLNILWQVLGTRYLVWHSFMLQRIPRFNIPLSLEHSEMNGIHSQLK
jgi:hypothetical protein